MNKLILNFDTLLINSEVELTLKLSQNCVLTEKATRTAKAAEDGPPALAAVPAINVPSDLKFSVTDCKMYVPVVILQAEYEKNCMKN